MRASTTRRRLPVGPSRPRARCSPASTPSRHGALYHGSTLQLPEGDRTLAEAFQDAGYVTAGFVSNPNIKGGEGGFGFDRGFDEFFDSPVEDTVGLAVIRDSLFGEVVKKLTNLPVQLEVPRTTCTR